MEKDISCKQKEQEIRDNDSYIIISILLYFNIKAITKDKEAHYIDKGISTDDGGEKIPWTEEPGWLQSMELQRQHN